MAPPPLPKPKSLGDDAAMRMIMPVGRSGWAIAAGYLGLFALVIIPAPLALFASIMAFREIRRSRSTSSPKHGMGRAWFGFITGLLGTGFLTFMLIASMLG